LESRHKYGVLAAGAVRTSLIGRLASRARDLGPVCGVSYRVASRIANALRAGYPVRTVDELGVSRAVLVYSPPEQLERLLELLEKAEIDWSGKAIIFCECDLSHGIPERFAQKGASQAVIRELHVPPRLIAEGAEGAALHIVQGLARELGLKAVGISQGSADLFAAAITLGSAAITPLIDRATALLREAGVRDVEAVRITSAVFEQTARDYAHSGKQSWAWHAQTPSVEKLERRSRGPRRSWLQC